MVDESGLLMVPQGIAAEVVRQAEAHRRMEAEYFDFLKSDTFTHEALKARLTPH